MVGAAGEEAVTTPLSPPKGRASEAEIACAGLDLVLGLEVIRAICGNAIDGQNDVSNAHLGSGCFASIDQQQEVSNASAGAGVRVPSIPETTSHMLSVALEGNGPHSAGRSAASTDSLTDTCHMSRCRLIYSH
ncbi:hypothetical protein EYF80_008578 [Liparis tanakae]|uniref:Uncharacterized protein n=1 Tax=Liparis tanakae TaxID=230148 RepID=A0A4Z2IUP3_9TELE|nr:hypothetical protein EYF80_008578 [Liparis tanakae]